VQRLCRHFSAPSHWHPDPSSEIHTSPGAGGRCRCRSSWTAAEGGGGNSISRLSESIPFPPLPLLLTPFPWPDDVRRACHRALLGCSVQRRHRHLPAPGEKGEVKCGLMSQPCLFLLLALRLRNGVKSFGPGGRLVARFVVKRR